MIAVDTSALMAVLLNEPQGAPCFEVLLAEPELRMSAATLAEALIVAGRNRIAEEMTRMIDALNVEIVPVTAASARRAADAYNRWGKGVHPAGLNYGDCFSYEAAKSLGCKLLFIGDDFTRTDVEPA